MRYCIRTINRINVFKYKIATYPADIEYSAGYEKSSNFIEIFLEFQKNFLAVL